MAKSKVAICPACGKKIGRHDSNRATVRVAKGSAGQGVFRDYHLACSQR